MIVVDTSVLVDLFKGRRTPAVERLRTLEHEGIPFLLPAVCCQELLQGARDEREWRLLEDYLGVQRILDCTDGLSTWAKAARIYFECRQKGVPIQSTIDCLIAQLVIDADGVLLHDKRDFELIKEVRPLKTIRS